LPEAIRSQWRGDCFAAKERNRRLAM